MTVDGKARLLLQLFLHGRKGAFMKPHPVVTLGTHQIMTVVILSGVPKHTVWGGFLLHQAVCGKPLQIPVDSGKRQSGKTLLQPLENLLRRYRALRGGYLC